MVCKWFDEDDRHRGFKKLEGNVAYPLGDK